MEDCFSDKVALGDIDSEFVVEELAEIVVSGVFV